MSAVMDKILNETGRAVASYLDACVHCGNCAEACHFYEVTRDTKYVPALKFDPLLKAYKRHKAPFSGLRRALGIAPAEVTDTEVAQWQELLYDSCTMCGRCTMVCPMGIDIASIVGMCRKSMADAGMAPKELIEIARRSKEEGSPLGVTPQVLKDRLEWIADDNEVEIPLDKPKAQVLLTMSSIEIMKYPADVAAVAKILNHAGIDWTMSSKGYEATNFGYLSGDREITKIMTSRIVDAAESIGAKTVIVPECGHAYGVMRWQAGNIVGRELPFEVLHISEFLERMRLDGQLKLKPLTKTVTFHDPCQIVRRGGAGSAPRNVLASFATDFREMDPTADQNWCCGGGGGVTTLSSAKHLQYKVFEIKKRQVAQTGATAMVSSCSNCRLVIDEDIEHVGWDKENLSLVDLVAEHLEG